MIYFLGLRVAQTGVAIQKQQLQFNGKEMGNSERLNGIGVGEGDLITMTQKASGGYLI